MSALLIRLVIPQRLASIQKEATNALVQRAHLEMARNASTSTSAATELTAAQRNRLATTFQLHSNAAARAATR